MSSLQDLDFNYKLFLDKSTILYGEQKTGKSTIIIDILYHLKPHIDQIIVICPTDRVNHTYSGTSRADRVVPLPCIHYTITDKLLTDIWARQEALSAVYNRANKPDVIRSLMNRLNLVEVETAVEKVRESRERFEAEIRAQYTDEEVIKNKLADMEDDYNRLVTMIYKHHIGRYRSKLASEPDLTPDERFTLKYLNINPRLVLIFDDCTDLLWKFRTHPVMQKIAYQARWSYITTLIACHTDKSLDPAFKKCAFNSFFTEDSCARAYYNRSSNDFDATFKAKARAAMAAAFTPANKHQKLVWVREDKSFYKFTAVKHDNFTFGSNLLWDFFEPIESNDVVSFGSDNRFMNAFAA